VTPSSEILAALDLVEMLFTNRRTGVLIGLLTVAAVSDVRTGRIPNWLVFGGALYGLAYNALHPVYPRDIGIVFALGGLSVGLVALLPGYLLRVLGAGDVKLMAMVGSFVGTWAAVEAVLASLITGGVLAVVLSLYSGRLPMMLRNVAALFRGTVLTFATAPGGLTIQGGRSAGRMPYGLAIALGTIGYLVLEQLGMI
jgi:prepilin peptidase CpaA